jgi:hypothetical protein
MLIEFSVENFRSIRTRQTLSMVAAARLHKKQNTIKPSVQGEARFPALLKVVAIYGPNASGKSTLIRALDVLQNICHRKPSAEKQPFPVSSFRFDPGLKDKPSIFEVHFIENRVRYAFELELTVDRIHRECLTFYKKGSPHILYERTYQEGQDAYKFGDLLEGGRDLHEAWRMLTGGQTLFLAQAVANSNEELMQLKQPFRWLDGLMVESDGMRSSAGVSRRLIADMPSFGHDVANLLSDVDVPVSAIHSKLQESEKLGLNSLLDLQKDESATDKPTALRSTLRVTTTLTHKSSLGEADFDYEEESEGTKNLLGSRCR